MKKVIINKTMIYDYCHWSGPEADYELTPVINEDEDVGLCGDTVGYIYLERYSDGSQINDDDEFYVIITRVDRENEADNGETEYSFISIDAYVTPYKNIKPGEETIGDILINTTIYHYKDGEYEIIRKEDKKES